MKQHASTVDTRIKEFMMKKMTEFPDLEDDYQQSRGVSLRGYFLGDIFALFSRKG